MKTLSKKLDVKTRELRLNMFRTMLRIRKFENAAFELYKANMVKGFMHLSVGQEAIPTGVCSALRDDDYISTTHRGHGDTIAKGVTVESAMAELFGKTTGICRGRGGSLHIADLSKNILGANGIVGAGIPIAVGAALSARYRHTDQVAVAFFGDGASMGGPIHESMNMASLWHLAMIFVRENNHYAESTPFRDHTGIPDIVSWAEGYGMKACRVDGNDVLAVREAALEAVARARSGGGPSFIECPTYRWLGHNTGDSGTWRPADEIAAWKARDPIASFRAKLVESKIASDSELDAIDVEEEQRLHQAVAAADAASKPDLQCAFEHTYADPVLGAKAMRGVRP
jgi:TPP-dependent pyruvate/acetoin dehydrogenase alpha subunit